MTAYIDRVGFAVVGGRVTGSCTCRPAVEVTWRASFWLGTIAALNKIMWFSMFSPFLSPAKGMSLLQLTRFNLGDSICPSCYVGNRSGIFVRRGEIGAESHTSQPLAAAKAI